MTNSAIHKVGSIEIFSLSDGNGEFAIEMFSGAEPSQIENLLETAKKSRIETNFNALLIRSESGNTLVDTGMRGLSGPATGHLPAALESLGISANNIDTLILTHLHPDHIAGAITSEGEAVYKSAEVVITSSEIDYWSNLDNFSDANLQDFQRLAASVLKAYEGRIRSVENNAAISPGISLMDMPGHTPGHVGILIDSGGQNFIFATDIFHAQDIQLSNPDISIAFDLDKETAVKTRKRILELVALEKTCFAAGHILGAQIGQIEKSGSGYEFIALS